MKRLISISWAKGPIIVGGLCFCSTIPVMADPCTASLPKPGTSFAGVVRYVGDGDSLCVGHSTVPNSWIEVRVADFYAPELHDSGGKEAKATLERIALGKNVQCMAGKRSYDRVVATCSLNGLSLGDHMRRSGIKEAGRGFGNRSR